MNACQHTANRAACELKRRDIERKKLSTAPERCQLVWPESFERTRGQRQKSPVARLQFDRVAGKLRDLVR